MNVQRPGKPQQYGPDISWGHSDGSGASFATKVRSSLPSLTIVPPNVVQYCSELSVVTMVTGAMLAFTSTKTCVPLQTTFTTEPFLTSTRRQVAPVGSSYR